MQSSVDFHDADTVIISEEYSKLQGIQGDMPILILLDNTPIQVSYPLVNDTAVNSIVLPFWYSEIYTTDPSRFKIQSLNNFVVAEEIRVQFISRNHEGVNLNIVRQQLLNCTYIINNQIINIRPDERQIRIRLESRTSTVLKLSRLTRFRFFGEYIPSIESVGGQKDLIDWYHNTYLFSLRAKNYLQKWAIPTPSGLLLSGKPGLGKTHFLKAMIADSGVYHISVFAPNIITPLAGDGDMVLMNTFEEARKNAPAIISIDEIDALCIQRSGSNQTYENRVVTVLLQEMDGVRTRGDVLVIGTTNRPEAIDEAFKRPGRLSKHIELQLPNKKERSDILNIYLKKTRHSLKSHDFIEISERTEGYTGADISYLVQKAGLWVIKKHLDNNEELVIDKNNIIHFISKK